MRLSAIYQIFKIDLDRIISKLFIYRYLLILYGVSQSYFVLESDVFCDYNTPYWYNKIIDRIAINMHIRYMLYYG
jgi:hypothetical protein